VAILGAGAAGVLSSMFAFPRLPAPTGTSPVGTRWLVLVDSSRNDSTPGSYRTLLVRLWYPADSVTGRPVSLWSLPVARQLATVSRLPGFAFRYAARVPTHSYADVPLSRAAPRFPVVLFSHGTGARGFESQNTILMEALASHGYIVASTAHPEYAGIVVFPNGRIVAEQHDDASLAASFDRAAGTLLNTFKRADTLRQLALLDTLARVAVLRQPIMDSWMADTRFTLTQLRVMNERGPRALFPDRPAAMALESVGMVGWSLGGALTTEFCILEPSCGAGVSLDGLAFSALTRRPMPRPFLYLSSSDNFNEFQLFYHWATPPVYRAVIPHTRHPDFTDIGLIAPAGARARTLGGIDPRRMQAILGRLVVAFFDAHLSGARPFPEQAIRDEFPEITLESRVGR
jgi:predicted dienelactone hydrolase